MVAVRGSWSPSPCAARSGLLQSDGKLAKVKKGSEKSNTGESQPNETRWRLARCAQKPVFVSRAKCRCIRARRLAGRSGGSQGEGPVSSSSVPIPQTAPSTQ